MGNGMVFLLLFPKGTCPRPQPAQPVGGPLRAFQCEGRRPGTKKEVQPPPTQPHQRRGSRGRNLLPRGFFPPFLPKKWGPGWASHRSLPFQRRRRNPATRPAQGAIVPPLQRREDILHPPSRQSPPAQTKNTAVPHRPRRCFFSARRKRPPQSPISRSRFTISTALRAQS